MTQRDIRIQTTVVRSGTVLPRPPLWMHKEDRAAQGYIRSCAPCPAVWVLKDDPHVQMSEQWQYYLRAINYNMTLENAFLLLDDHLAFANNTGFRNLDNPSKKDYFFKRTNYAQLPSLDKVRTCSRNVLTGEVQGDYLNVMLFDSRRNPPLKPGRSYPSKVEDANLDDYLYSPQTHPWMFIVANIVNRAGEVVQFPRGAVYSWTNDNTPRSFMPHIYNPDFGPVRYELDKLVSVPDNAPVPSPYRRNSQ